MFAIRCSCNVTDSLSKKSLHQGFILRNTEFYDYKNLTCVGYNDSECVLVVTIMYKPMHRKVM